MGQIQFSELSTTATTTPSSLPTPSPTAQPTPAPYSDFLGLQSLSGKTDTTLTLTWASHSSAVSYDIYDVSSIVTLVGSTSATTYSFSTLSPGTTYKFRVRMKDASNVSDSNTNDLSVTMNAAPDVPSSLTRLSPSAASDYPDVVTVRVGGVKAGDTVRLFTDASCSAQVGSALASGVTVDITSSALAVGAYSFYANSTKANASGYVLSNGSCVLSYAGLSSVSNKTDSTLTLNWPTHPAAIAYDIYDWMTGAPVLIASVTDQAST